MREQLAATLDSLIRKMQGARVSPDLIMTGWSAAWSGPALVPALFAANDRPVPPASVLLSSMLELPAPVSLPGLLERWFTGAPGERLDAAIDVARWCLASLSGTAHT